MNCPFKENLKGQFLNIHILDAGHAGVSMEFYGGPATKR
jgi:hypothetical protein